IMCTMALLMSTVREIISNHGDTSNISNPCSMLSNISSLPFLLKLKPRAYRRNYKETKTTSEGDSKVDPHMIV
ncbi:hypothetical protein NPIL_505911, partial [Nephila pilipes]